MMLTFYCSFFVFDRIFGKSLELNPYAEEGLDYLQPIMIEKQPSHNVHGWSLDNFTIKIFGILFSFSGNVKIDEKLNEIGPEKKLDGKIQKLIEYYFMLMLKSGEMGVVIIHLHRIIEI